LEKVFFLSCCCRLAPHVELGKEFSVYGLDEKKTIEVVLPFISADTPARICAGGCMSIHSEKHMCYNCDKTFSSLVDPTCFDRSSQFPFGHFIYILHAVNLLPAFNHRDLNSQLKWRFIHGETDDEDIKAHIEEKRGVRKSKFDELAGWHAPLSLPPEAMHLFFGGGMSNCRLASHG